MYKDEQGDEKALQWTNSFQFPTHPVTQTTQTNPRRRDSGKIRARWSIKARYKPTKTKWPNTLDLPMTNMNMTDSNGVMVLLSVQLCDRFGLMCHFCKQSTQHPSPQESDWMDGDWNGEEAKAKKLVGETNHMSDWDLPSPQYNPNSKPEKIDKINIDRLNLDPD